MPKIRGIKPDYWTDEAIVELSLPARLLFIGLWNYACDNGHLQDKPKQIKMRVFPGDDVSAAELLRELDESGRITRAGGWITVPNLTHHQKPDRRYFTTCDKEGCEDPPEKVSQRESRRVHAVHTPSAPGAPAGRTVGARVEGDGEGEVMVNVKGKETPSRKRSDTHPRFDEFWNTYGKKVDRKRAEQRWAVALKKPGVTADLLIASAAAYVLSERENQGGRFILDPSRWLLGERWADERPARAAPRTRVQEHLALVQQLGEHASSPFPEIGPAS